LFWDHVGACECLDTGSTTTRAGSGGSSGDDAVDPSDALRGLLQV